MVLEYEAQTIEKRNEDHVWHSTCNMTVSKSELVSMFPRLYL